MDMYPYNTTQQYKMNKPQPSTSTKTNLTNTMLSKKNKLQKNTYHTICLKFKNMQNKCKEGKTKKDIWDDKHYIQDSVSLHERIRGMSLERNSQR